MQALSQGIATMKLLALFLLSLSFVGCGKGGSSSPAPAVMPPAHIPVTTVTDYQYETGAYTSACTGDFRFEDKGYLTFTITCVDGVETKRHVSILTKYRGYEGDVVNGAGVVKVWSGMAAQFQLDANTFTLDQAYPESHYWGYMILLVHNG